MIPTLPITTTAVPSTTASFKPAHHDIPIHSAATAFATFHWSAILGFIMGGCVFVALIVGLTVAVVKVKVNMSGRSDSKN